MARVAVSYSGTSLQTSTYVTQEIEHESINHKELDIQRLDSRDGGKLISPTFAPKRINIKGLIKAGSQSALESAIDALKKLLNKSGQDLDIGYAGSTRRYVCDMATVTLVRRHFNITFADFEASFLVSKTPFAKTLDTSTSEYTASSISTWAGSFVAQGTYRPLPRIEVTFTEANNITRLRFRNITTGDMIIVDNNSGFNAGDVVVVNCSDYTVTLNGAAWDYSGFFPSFIVDGNDFRVSVESGISYKMTVKIIYYPLYL